MRKLLGLLVMSGAVLAALYFLTSLARIGKGPTAAGITLGSAVVEFNHPLTGTTLNFHVKIKNIKLAEEK